MGRSLGGVSLLIAEVISVRVGKGEEERDLSKDLGREIEGMDKGEEGGGEGRIIRGGGERKGRIIRGGGEKNQEDNQANMINFI